MSAEHDGHESCPYTPKKSAHAISLPTIVWDVGELWHHRNRCLVTITIKLHGGQKILSGPGRALNAFTGKLFTTHVILQDLKSANGACPARFL
jgi:hypothetical protein